jgi:1,4-dihydroxy-6-naphthoate synthase
MLRLGHSPDPDDAFMWWPLLAVDGAPPRLEAGGFRFEAVTQDIETLNQRAMRGELEITAMSCAQWPHVADRYALTACGASLGDGYGPKLVAREAMALDDLKRPDAVIAIPGERTSAMGAASLMLGPGSFRWAVTPFEAVIPRVAAGEFAAGLVIHEGQLTFKQAGLTLLADVGAWWKERTGLPLPLGVNAIRRDLADAHGPGALAAVTRTLRRSVEYALAHRDESIAYALRYARDMGAALADAFVELYVNKWTLDFGATGGAAVRRFLSELGAAGLVPNVDKVSFIAPEEV